MLPTTLEPPMNMSQTKCDDAPPLLDEIIHEILSRLPVKSLSRFRCVCKSWNTKISNPNFIKLHLERSRRNPHLTLLSSNRQDNDFNVVPFPVRRFVDNPLIIVANDPYCRFKVDDCYKVIGSCNGLLCLLGCNCTLMFEEYWLYLWNPAMRLRSEKLVSLLVNPESSAFKFAFGYDNSRDTYKVVAFCLEDEGNDSNSLKSQVKIFSLSENYWRDIESLPVVPLDASVTGYNDGVYLNGTLNWVALRNNLSPYYDPKTTTIEQFVILSLDLGKETYKQLLLPHIFNEVPYHEPTVGVLIDNLCFSHDFRGTHFNVWQMKEFGVDKSWTQLLTISYEDLGADHKHFRLRLLPLCLSENSDVLVMASAGEREAFMYNKKDNEVERTRITKYISWGCAKDYVQSLVWPC